MSIKDKLKLANGFLLVVIWVAGALIALFFRSEPDGGGESVVSPGERQVLVVRGVRQAMLRQTQSQGAHLPTAHRRRRRLDVSCLLICVQKQECAQKAYEKNALKKLICNY